MSRILLVVDGMTDPSFRVEDYPALATMHPLPPIDYAAGGPPETLLCTLRILGAKVVSPHMRPVVEALGAGLPVRQDDLWLRASWYHLGPDARPDRQEEPPVEPLIPKPPHPTIIPYDIGQGHRLFLIRHGRPLADRLTLGKPFLSATGRGDFLPEGADRLRVYFSHYRTKEYQLIPWAIGLTGQVPEVSERRGTIIASELVLLGLGRLLRWRVVTDPRLTGDTDTDLGRLAEMILEIAEEEDFVLAHVNGADQAAHRLDAAGKRAFLERVDQGLIAPLLHSPHRLLVTSDHGSDPVTGRHLAGPQPRLLHLSDEL